MAKQQAPLIDPTKLLVDDISQLIEEARNHVAREYNSTQVVLCWLIGKRIDEEFLKSQRAEYGENIVVSLVSELSLKYGRGYSRPNIFRMIKFAKLFPDKKIISTLSRQLSWSHFILICSIDDELKRNFYTEMCRMQNWSVRALKKQLDSRLYERTSLSKQPDNVIKSQISKLQSNDEMTAELIFKDPYFINFINGHDYQSEEDLETLILNNIMEFLQELGSDFCFVARQKRMSTGKKDRYLDLLFFNRRLSRLIAIDLKLGEFDPAHKGQMEWYLNWLDKNERLPREEKPVGIILCAGKDQDDIEYLEMDKTGIHVAQYLTELPSREILDQKLKQAITLAKENQAKKKFIYE
ncbi:MAG: PDDEXK nuclease domain-containing protein [Alphaproteobacteria bacterium]|nr:PDDEXK nuclease domain-containing protein [Alphaproteobacteria bacterium]